MKTFYDCIPCFVKQTLSVARLSLPDDEELHGQILKRVLNEAIDLEMSTPPPVVASKIHRIIKEMTGNNDPYKQVKEKFNKEALKLYPEMKKYLLKAEDPFEVAVRLAIAGNVIDFGHHLITDDIKLIDSTEEILSQVPFIDHINLLREEITKANRILYIADNTGEIVFDRVFIEHILPKNITLAVRKHPIINDATYEDASFAGLTDIVKVIDNGSDVPGSYLPECSEEFVREFNSADLIISKGQGNFETLSDEDANIFFLLRAKCLCVAQEIGCKLNDIIVMGSNYVKTTF